MDAAKEEKETREMIGPLLSIFSALAWGVVIGVAVIVIFDPR